MKYVCELCGMVYDEAIGDAKHGIPAGTAFTDLPQDFTCPLCGSEREAFSQMKPKADAPSGHLPKRSRQYVKYADAHRESER